MLDEPLANLDLASQRATVHVLAKLNRELNMTIQVVAHDLNMLLPILTGAVYLLDGHPPLRRATEVLDSDLLTPPLRHTGAGGHHSAGRHVRDPDAG